LAGRDRAGAAGKAAGVSGEYEPEDVSFQAVGRVELECGMGSGAWDTIDPRDIVAAVLTVYGYNDLLAACEVALANLDYLTETWGQEGVTRTVQDKLRAAIARATGGTP
jgi:hypothetical protein